jgi:hypothetical protein
MAMGIRRMLSVSILALERGITVVGVLVPRTARNRENRRNLADATVVVAYCRHTKSNERYETFH